MLRGIQYDRDSGNVLFLGSSTRRASGFRTKVVQEGLGHASPVETLKTYAPVAVVGRGDEVRRRGRMGDSCGLCAG
jgi:hypothetical protein